ncbi:hypothetical protein A3860_11245 [Niastella vici]|uniref:histidine kinase n=1 Tax=Niastella vici TaxID=1703345 RepID=A0A1V9FFT5_9BACT|nr:histidine kinase dimerization/phospho-acceptor domain-containing protein [Niastella vici]OQP57131.1 hypothetical protein A3860_11245 [Niastella vici]
MGRRSTKLKIAFFSVLLTGFVVIQYSYVISLRKDKLERFKSRVISCMARTGEKIASNNSKDVLTNSELAFLLQQSFSAKGLGDLQFEYSFGSGNKQLASRDFNEKLKANPANLVLCYELPPFGRQEIAAPPLTLVVPYWKKIALKELGWVIAAAVFFTLMLAAIFWVAIILGDRRQQLFYDNREKIIQYLMQQLETPLSTMSVAAEALRNKTVMHDPGQTSYYQQVINEENKRMREQVEKLLRELM